MPLTSNSFPMTWGGSLWSWDGNIDSLKTWDTANRYDYFNDLPETVTITEAKSNQPRVAKPEAFSVVDQREPFVIGKAALELIAFVDTVDLLAGFKRTIAESFAISDVRTVSFTQGALAEAIAVVESLFKTVEHAEAEAFSLADAFDALIVIERLFAETLVIAEAVSKGLDLGIFAESLTVTERRVTRGPVVFADIAVRGGDLSLADFTQMVSNPTPTIYNPFVPFIPGDYDLTRALVKLSLRRESAGQDLRVVVGKVFVDVPDVTDRGRVTITTSSSMAVTFNRKFLAAPEVNVTNITSAVLVTPRVTNVTKTGFTIELLNSSGSPVNGSASWVAEGY